MSWIDIPTLLLLGVAALALGFRKPKPKCQHEWHSRTLYKLDEGPLFSSPDHGIDGIDIEQLERVGVWMEGKSKAVCKHCKAAKLIDVEIQFYNDGRRVVTCKDGVTTVTVT